MFASFALVAIAVSSVHAMIQPTAPGPGDSFKQGEKCKFTWDADPDSVDTWKQTNVQLMTGDNYNMVHLDTVATIDGTQSGVFEFDCPQVTPFSAIYFYQFTNPVDPDPDHKVWTTRFTISSPTGESVPPTEALQPTTKLPIPWGTGKLVDSSKARPPPAYLAGGVAANPSASLPGGGLSSVVPSTGSVVPSNSVVPSTPANTGTKPAIPSDKINAGSHQVSHAPSSSGAAPTSSPIRENGAKEILASQAGIAMSLVAGIYMLCL